MNSFGFLIFLIYLVILSLVLLLARKGTLAKRASVKKHFNLEDHQIRSTGYENQRIRKLISLGWSLAFAMAGVLVVPIVAIGDDVLVQMLAILTTELSFLVAGLVAINAAGIINWYLECYISNVRFFRSGFSLAVLAVILANVAFTVRFFPLGLEFQAAAVIIMALAMYFMISPILKEMEYYN